MLLSKLLPAVLATCVTAVPDGEMPVVPIALFYSEPNFKGEIFGVREAYTCVPITGPVRGHVRSARITLGQPALRYCNLYESDNCNSNVKYVIFKGNSRGDFPHTDDIRSIRCQDVPI
ncbi:hypothetical protein GGI35DRAFT_435071 [Trichoderma velutinum]